MPAHVPPPPPPLGLTPVEQRKALEKSKTRLMRHAILSAAVALFLIGFNAAFTRGIIWFPWPVAALFILWLIHLQKHLASTRTDSLSFNVWMDDNPRDVSGGRTRDANGFEKDEADFESELAEEWSRHEDDRPSRRRRREWLE